MDKPELLLLHGALGSQTAFDALRPGLTDYFQLHSLDFEGHGPRKTDRSFRIAHFAENVLDYMDDHHIPQIDIFGYSMGGYVALYLAREFPQRVNNIFTLATKFHWTPDGAEKEVKMLDPDIILPKVPHFAKALMARHTGQGWREVLLRTSEMMLSLGKEPVLWTELSDLPHHVRVGIGDRDTMVTLEESLELYRLLQHGELQVLPATHHPLEKVDVERLGRAIREFFIHGRKEKK